MPVKLKQILLFSGIPLLLICLVNPCLAQDAAPVVVAPANAYDTLRYTMITIAFILVAVILALAYITNETGRLYLRKQKEKEEKTGIKFISILFFLFSLPLASLAQVIAEAAPKAAGINLPADLYFYFTVIILELGIVFFLVRMIYGFIREPKVVMNTEPVLPKFNFIKKLLRPQPLEVQQQLDLNHDYDGIRELDNDIPRWWKLAFLGTILFGFVYLFRMFVSQSMPLQLQELSMANEIADEKKLAYLKASADNIDENSVKMLGVEDIAGGRELFTKNCVACHGDRAQGGVGPNLTDDRWLHKGGIHDIFFSIKYGWEDKGMKSWKNDFSPKQIAELASFIKSIENTHVEGGKGAQGDLYVDAAAIALSDSAQNIQPPPSLPEKK